MMFAKKTNQTAVKLSITETIMAASMSQGTQIKAYLVNGIGLETSVEGFSDKAIIGRAKDGQPQIIYRHALSTLGSTSTNSRFEPLEGLDESDIEGALLAEYEGERITVFLLNGIKLEGDLLGFDENTILISSANGGQNVIMKPAIATIVL